MNHVPMINISPRREFSRAGNLASNSCTLKPSVLRTEPLALAQIIHQGFFRPFSVLFSRFIYI